MFLNNRKVRGEGLRGREQGGSETIEASAQAMQPGDISNNARKLSLSRTSLENSSQELSWFSIMDYPCE